jgi:L-Ala-D/L-Glu epimerase / N-acetyl-D-glutamate racemase
LRRPEVSGFVCAVKLRFWRKDLQLAHTWTIARGSADVFQVGFVELTDVDGITGLGEGSPSPRYGESVGTIESFCQQVDAAQLSFDDVLHSMSYVEALAPGNMSAKCALSLALFDGAAKRTKKPLYDFLGLGFRENHHVTSFSIGIDKPDVIRKKALAAEEYPVLKLKVGVSGNSANLAALREVAPTKPVRVDANEAWRNKELALEMIEKLAHDPHVEFVEQPMPARTDSKDLVWLKQRSPVPLFADESYHLARDVAHCAECYHGVNVKLVKTGGVSAGFEALRAARKAGLKTMLGCMIETSVLISAAAHLAELCDFLDLDGNLLTTNDPYLGVTAPNGILSFASAPAQFGLRICPRSV